MSTDIDGDTATEVTGVVSAHNTFGFDLGTEKLRLLFELVEDEVIITSCLGIYVQTHLSSKSHL